MVNLNLFIEELRKRGFSDDDVAGKLAEDMHQERMKVESVDFPAPNIGD